MEVGGTVAVAGAAAVLVSAFTGLGGWRLARRAQTSAERREEEIERAPYLQQLQDWSQRLLKEEADRRSKDRVEFEEQRAKDQAECERRLTRRDVEHERIVRDLEAQWGARVLTAERREQAWRRRAEGTDSDPPP
jgi:flagellar basal body-associated protein FliL